MKNITKEELQEAVNKNTTVGGVLREQGYDHHQSGRYVWIKKLFNKFDIDTTSIESPQFNKHSVKYSSSDMFSEGSTVARGKVRNKIIKEKLIPYRCDICGNEGEWNGKVMALELDHINGVPNDNRLENLRFLCPNCHATTDTYCGKNAAQNQVGDPCTDEFDPSVWNNNSDGENCIAIKREPKQKIPRYCANCGKLLKTNATYCRPCSQRRLLQRPSPIEIAEKVKEKGFWNAAKDYGVSDNAVRKWCKDYGIPIHTKELIQWLEDQQ